MKNSKITVFYTPKQVNTNQNIIGTTSRSPLKPMLLMKAFQMHGMADNFDIKGDFSPFEKQDFLIAHTEQYVNSFFTGGYLASSNGLPWSKELADSVRYTNASLYNAVRHAYLNPNDLCFSPTSGFHHAKPTSGVGFCTFSGQVIASVKMYREFGISGAYLDLDGHYGNSIEDSRSFVHDLDLAVPGGFNFGQLRGGNEYYHASLVDALAKIEEAVFNNQIHYVVWAHGADSHSNDDLGGQVNTEWWVKCSETFYGWVAKMDEKLAAAGRGPLPVIMSLFGGYRRDNYYAVLSLHIKDTVVALNTLCGKSISYSVKNERSNFATEGWSSLDGMLLPNSLINAVNVAMSKNEKLVLEFLTKNPGYYYSGNMLGLHIKGWKNHSMGKWAKRLVKRGTVQFSYKIGYTVQK